MAESPYDHPDFGTNEENWPDPDVDSGTEEGAEIMRRNEAAFIACMNRSIENRQRRPQAAYGHIPQDLYVKALDHQDQLTHEERQLLLSHNVVGKALAYPNALTVDEIHELLYWPSPDVVRANIQRTTGGALSTPTELYAKGKDALNRSQFDAVISDDEVLLICQNFYTDNDPNFSPCRRMAASEIPGYSQAHNLLARRLGLDVAFLKAAGDRYSEDIRREMKAARSAPLEVPYFLKSPNINTTARPPAEPYEPSLGSRPQGHGRLTAHWPAPRRRALRLLKGHGRHGRTGRRRTARGPRRCGVRREAWARVERQLALKEGRELSPDDSRQLQGEEQEWLARVRGSEFADLKPVVHVSGFELFRDELRVGAGTGAGPETTDAGLDFWEVLRRGRAWRMMLLARRLGESVDSHG